MLQTALAMRTTTLRLGTAVIVLPWHNPVLLAEQAATLDLISGGRLDFGIGKGYRHNEFAGFRIPPEEAEPRFEESVEVMTKAFTSRQRFSHRGKFWQFDDIVVEPPPSQQPHPPFWVAAGSEASIRRAAQRGFNLILDQYASPEVIGQRIALYRAERQAAASRHGADRGRPPGLCRQRPGRRGSGAAKAGGMDQANGRGVARAGRQDRLPRPGLCGDAAGHRSQCALRHAGRDRRDARQRCKRPASNTSS